MSHTTGKIEVLRPTVRTYHLSVNTEGLKCRVALMRVLGSALNRIHAHDPHHQKAPYRDILDSDRASRATHHNHKSTCDLLRGPRRQAPVQTGRLACPPVRRRTTAAGSPRAAMTASLTSCARAARRGSNRSSVRRRAARGAGGRCSRARSPGTERQEAQMQRTPARAAARAAIVLLLARSLPMRQRSASTASAPEESRRKDGA